MSLTRAIQIFLVQNRHMAQGSTNARFIWHPFLKETEQELHLRAGEVCGGADNCREHAMHRAQPPVITT